MTEEQPDTLRATAGVTPAELQAAFSGPAIFVNKFLLTISPSTARLSFLEVPPEVGTPAFRGAVQMTISDLVELRNLLNRMVPDDKIRTLPMEDAPDASKG